MIPPKGETVCRGLKLCFVYNRYLKFKYFKSKLLSLTFVSAKFIAPADLGGFFRLAHLIINLKHTSNCFYSTGYLTRVPGWYLYITCYYIWTVSPPRLLLKYTLKVESALAYCLHQSIDLILP